MPPGPVEPQHLLSLPPRMVGAWSTLEQGRRGDWFVGHDPEGRPLGSGGGTAHLLVSAWRASGSRVSFAAWLAERSRLLIHAGGQSRRLPAYAATGKALLPVPVFRWARGQRFDQCLLDVQLPDFHRVLRHAGGPPAVLVASGDVLLRFDHELPPFPEVDVLGLGMWTTAEVAQHFGVFFTPPRQPEQLKFFLQKPAPDTVRELGRDHLFLVDTGMWLLRPRAVEVLLRRCGWDPATETFPGGSPSPYELYAAFGLSLGSQPTRPDPEISRLTCAVVPLPRPEFHHFGTTRQMIESLTAVQNRVLDQRRLMGAAGHSDQHTQNARVEVPLHRGTNATLWIENAVIPDTWKLSREHVLTGVPPNRWTLTLEPGVCLDFVPVEGGGWVVRFYGIDDLFSGAIDDPGTRLLGIRAVDWMSARGLHAGTDGLTGDLQRVPLFPEVDLHELTGAHLEWLFQRTPVASDAMRSWWRSARRYSAADLLRGADLPRLYEQRSQRRDEALVQVLAHRSWSVFHRLDLEAAARMFARLPAPLPEGSEAAWDPLPRVHEAMFRAAVRRHRGEDRWRQDEAAAFEALHDLLSSETRVTPVRPRAQVVEDQIVWARSPVRLDLAGGWTDTPPYCLEHGGRVVNVAVDLNGQPPLQVFARLSSRAEIVLRSIDLGVEERIRSHAELAAYREPGSAFALARAACALAGFLPRYHGTGGYGSLAADLEAFGGGLELSLLAAVPKGSGLGTSSILAATLLAALSEVCGLGWNSAELFQRTLALEQMITTGGGWQDQAGGLLPGLKLIETEPGLVQVPRVRWLPERFFRPGLANRRLLLYYTGLTRLAKGILEEVVRGMLLNSPEHLATLDQIGTSARTMSLALEQCDEAAFAAALRQTWDLKQQLDPGSNPPAVQAILDQVRPHLAAATLPGAGGGGYLLMLARDDEAGERIRSLLGQHPPNPRARFVDFSLSTTGLQVTRS